MDKILDITQFKEYIKANLKTRKIVQLHIHHTWSPSHKDFNGTNALALQQSMREFHINTKGWADIGQHFTLMPDGTFVTGRSLERDPASIAGWNTGAIAIEMLGNFNIGFDTLEGKQLDSILEACAFILKYFALSYDMLKFHRDNPTAGKTCPGNGINKPDFLYKVSTEGVFMDTFKDHNNVSVWAKPAVQALAEKGIVKGDENGNFNPKNTVTREEMAVMLARALGLIK